MQIQELVDEYRKKTDEELLQLASDREQLTPEAATALRDELARRQISHERLEAFSKEEERQVPHTGHTDLCRRRSFSFARFVLMATLFLCMTVGSLPLFFLLMKRPYGFQAASAIVYTIFAVFFTFARTGTKGGKDLPPYMFACPAVQAESSRLLRRHLGFLVALFALQTLAFAVRPHLPYWWNTEGSRGRSGMPPFDIALFFLCFGLATTQVFTNRSLLERAHREINV